MPSFGAISSHSGTKLPREKLKTLGLTDGRRDRIAIANTRSAVPAGLKETAVTN